MATFGAIIVTSVADHGAFYAATRALGVVRLRDGAKGDALTIDTSDTDFAARLSTIDGVGSAFGLAGQSAVDGYLVAEYARGELVRRVVYNRDYGGWEMQGTPRPWEADFHFAQTLERFTSKLDEEWTGAELARAKAAYEARDVAALEALPAIPRATYDQLAAFAAHLGYDFDAGGHARYAPKLFARLFRR